MESLRDRGLASRELAWITGAESTLDKFCKVSKIIVESTDDVFGLRKRCRYHHNGLVTTLFIVGSGVFE